MNIIKQLTDKIFFAAGVIIFLQLPHFIDQYTQRVGGYSASKNQQLEKYTSIASNGYNGDIDKLINSFKSSNDPAVQETGKNIEEIQTDSFLLKEELQILETEGLFRKIIFLITNTRIDLARGTIKNFQPGVPLNLWALAYGLFGGILFSLIFNGFLFIPKKVLEKRRIKRNKTFAS